MIIYEDEMPNFYKMLAKLNGEILKRARDGLQAIVRSDDPAALGVRKGTIKKDPKCAIYSYEINRSYRLLYCIGADCLRFISVGDHKGVYGKD